MREYRIGLLSFLLRCSVLLAVESAPCGGRFTAHAGVVQTPNFPGPFDVPAKCRWVIDASELTVGNGSSITIYLTQLYVYKGLTFTEYAYYESDALNLGAALIKEITEGNVFEYRWFRTFRPFLVVDLELDRLEGNHVRVLNDLLDVYGFNFTYEVTNDEINPNSCTVRDCSYAGNCRLSGDYRNFSCDCFKGFFGRNCADGPLCLDDQRNPVCRNGATCRHVGAEAVRCHCPPGFRGSNCEIRLGPPLDPECRGEACPTQCPYVENSRRPCDCKNGTKIYNDRSRYECRIKLSNLTSVRSGLAPRQGTLDSLLSKQLARYLRNSNITSAEDLKILNVTSASEVTFHFFGNSEDGDKIREALNRLVQRRRLGEIALESTHFTFQQKPALKLQSLRSNQVNEREVRLGDQFIFSCVAQGSDDIDFTWYKDDVLVNMSKAIRYSNDPASFREIWYKHLPNDGTDRHTSLLTIDRASLLDAGLYTCRVVDWGVQQCKSMYVDVGDEPEVKIIPMSATIEKGDDVQLMCVTPNMRSIEIGFGWSKNRALLKLEPGNEVWEDLYPAGSILKITNAQKTATYTCTVAHRSTTVRVEVVNRTTIPMCLRERSWDSNWPDTGPGSEALLDCPRRFVGRQVSRLCSMKDATTSEWRTPDFSACLYEPLVAPYNNFRSLTLGYQNASGAETIVAFWEVLRSRSLPLYPGEGDRILGILSEIENYQRDIGELNDLRVSVEDAARIIDRLLSDEKSILSQQKVVSLQQLVQRNMLYWTEERTRLYKHLVLPSMIADIRPLLADNEDETTRVLRVPTSDRAYPAWYGDRVTLSLRKEKFNKYVDDALAGIVVAYRNVSRFLPQVYIKELNDGTDLEYRINSRVLAVAVSPHDEEAEVRIDLRMSHSSNQSGLWNVSCGTMDAAGGAWDLDVCTANPLPGESATRCVCPRAGTFAVFLTARAVRVVPAQNERTTLVVLLGCGSCLLQCLISSLILGCYWWKNRTWLSFLKLQCCAALVGAMAVFIHAARSRLPESSFSLVAMSLEALLSVGISAPISQALMIYAELTNVRPGQNFQPTVVAVITGVPVLAVLATELTRKSTGWRHESWWLIFGSGVFNIFATCTTMLLLIFVLLYAGVLHKSRSLVEGNVVKRETVQERIRLLHRAATIICGIIATEASSILYVNSPSIVSHYAFASLSALLGFVVSIAYVTSGEIMTMAPIFRKLAWRHGPDDVRSSEPVKGRDAPAIGSSTRASVSRAAGPLCSTVCAKVDGEVENDAAPPFLAGRTYLDVRGGADTCEYVTRSVIPVTATSTFPPEVCVDRTDDINLESYSTSPRKYQEATTFDVAYAGRVARCAPEAHEVAEHRPLGDRDEFDERRESRTKARRVSSSGASPADCSATVLCSADVESGFGGVGAMPDVTLATKSEVALSTMTEAMSRERINAIPDIAHTIERTRPDDGGKMPEITVTDCESTSTGMLDRISHDLDYLLNRTRANEDA